jgi:large subunit ribosomal protein L25
MTITIRGERRDALGKNAAYRFRRQGLVPAVLYGEGADTVNLVLDKQAIFEILRAETRENTLFKVAIGDDVGDAMIKDLQVDPVTDEVLHADLIRIAMDKVIRVTVPVVHKGEPIGVKTEGGFVDFVTREVEVECLPAAIPERLEIDIAELHMHQSLKAGNLVLPPGLKLLTDPGLTLVTISLPHKEEEVSPGEKPEEAAAEGEAKEPEVIKKERAEKGEGKEPEVIKKERAEKGEGKEK